MFIDDQFANEILITNTIRRISNDAFVFIMEEGNFNLLYNQCLIKGLDIFNFISLNNITTPFDLILVFGSTNKDLQKYSEIPIIHITTQSVVRSPTRSVRSSTEATRSVVAYSPTQSIDLSSDHQSNEISRARSFQFIDESNPDIFLDKCCKTFIPDEQSIVKNEELPDSNIRPLVDPQEVWNTEAIDTTHRTESGKLSDQLDSRNTKFMQVMLIEAKRLGFRKKKEEFKKQIKKSSSASSLPIVSRTPKLPKSQSNIKMDRPLVGAERNSDRPLVGADQRSDRPLVGANQSLDRPLVGTNPLVSSTTLPYNRLEQTQPQKEQSPKTVSCKVNCLATCLATCLASTKKKGAPCTNSALPGTNYCGIPSHKKLGSA